jgi:hypothetical protein
MVGKTPMVLAPIVVVAAVLFLAFLAGRWWERSMRRYASSFIDPKTHGDLIELVRRVLKSVDVDQACYLPPPVHGEAEKLLAKADDQAVARQRYELRRRGF